VDRNFTFPSMRLSSEMGIMIQMIHSALLKMQWCDKVDVTKEVMVMNKIMPLIFFMLKKVWDNK
jgi:hypothetical protein